MTTARDRLRASGSARLSHVMIDHPDHDERPDHDDATVLVVASGKGGTGVSLVSALLGLAMAEDGRRVLLVDGTEGWGGLHAMLGVTPRHPLAALRGGVAQAEDMLVRLSDALHLMPGGADEPGAPPLTATERQLLARRVRELYADYDLVVVDAGSRLDAVLTACVDGVTRLLVVTTDDRIAMAASHALLKATDARLPGLDVDVLVNRATGDEAAAVHAHLGDAARRFLARAVGMAGAVPYDPCLQGGVSAGMPVQDAAAGSPVALAVRDAGLRIAAAATT